MKKVIIISLLLITAIFDFHAKEFTFYMSPIDDDSYSYKVIYNPTTKRFTFMLEEEPVSDYLFYKDDEDLERKIIFDNIAGVELYITDNQKNYGGNQGELLFITPDNIILFGAYVDPKKFDYDNRRKCYAIIGIKGKGLVKEDCYAMLQDQYLPFDEMIKLAKPLSSLQTTSKSTSTVSNSKTFSIMDYITKFFGVYDLREIGKDSYPKIENNLKKIFGKDISVDKFKPNFQTFEINEPNNRMNGYKPYKLSLSKGVFDMIGLVYEYTFSFDDEAEAMRFKNSLCNSINKDCSIVMTEDTTKGKDDISYNGEYKYKQVTYFLYVYYSKRFDGKYHVTFSCITNL